MADRDQAKTNVGDRGQVSSDAAEVYDEFFVLALFQQWTGRVADAARIGAGDRVLDVATGTGILARTVAERVGPAGSVVGLDINEGMLTVARRIAPHIEWRLDRAESLPFEDGSFDAVVSQFGLMFFEDKPGALREMMRVLRPGGRLAVAVWDSLDHTPGYNAMVALLERNIGGKAADALRAPFSLGDMQRLQALFAEAGIPEASIKTHAGQARFASIEAWVHTDIKGWIFAEMIDDTQYTRVLEAAKEAFAPFVTTEGSVAFDAPAHIVTASKGSGGNGRKP